jgi:hypothetical protein
MKKIIAAVSLLLFINIVISHAQTFPQDVKKTENNMKCGKSKAKCCGMMTETKSNCASASDSKSDGMKCDTTKCKAKCDPSNCKSASESTTAQMKDCDPAKCKMMNKK